MLDPNLQKVLEFHATFGHPIKNQPCVGNGHINKLRVDLIKEETQELIKALHLGDEVGALDALCDLQYVLDGAFLALGFAHMKGAAMDEVHRSNMSKLGADGKPVYRTDGKVMKGPNYTPPNLQKVINTFHPSSETPA